MSRIHAAFEFHPGTHLVLLTALSRTAPESSVQFQTTDGVDRVPLPIAGDGVIAYNTGYTVWIASYEFKLVWRTFSHHKTENHAYLKELARRGYQLCEKRLKRARSRDRATEEPVQEIRSWHNTRFNTAKNRPAFEDVPELRQALPGADDSPNGTIYKAVDARTGNAFVIKKVTLKGDTPQEVDSHRALLRREVKLLEALDHAHIIECLGCNDFQGPAPEIILPLRDGSLSSLAASLDDWTLKSTVCEALTEQMLGALDYLDSKKIIHRDVKPDNILFTRLLGDHQYLFQLADFGLSQHLALAWTMQIGTPYYVAPKLIHLSGVPGRPELQE